MRRNRMKTNGEISGIDLKQVSKAMAILALFVAAGCGNNPAAKELTAETVLMRAAAAGQGGATADQVAVRGQGQSSVDLSDSLCTDR